MYSVRIPRVNLYLPDDLAAAARPGELNLSSVLQDALRQRLGQRRLEAWLTRLAAGQPAPVGHAAARSALEWGLRGG
ncbi:MAG TPA: type II toxin-antitoxin system CcdA family antitoxin [Candidatus Dormibacteraeota bacterium]